MISIDGRIITIAGDKIVWIAGVLIAIGFLIGLIVKMVHWMDNQGLQDKKLKALEIKHDNDINEMNETLEVLSYGMLALIKAFQGDKSQVATAGEKIENRIREQAFKKKNDQNV